MQPHGSKFPDWLSIYSAIRQHRIDLHGVRQSNLATILLTQIGKNHPSWPYNWKNECPTRDKERTQTFQVDLYDSGLSPCTCMPLVRHCFQRFSLVADSWLHTRGWIRFLRSKLETPILHFNVFSCAIADRQRYNSTWYLLNSFCCHLYHNWCYYQR